MGRFEPGGDHTRLASALGVTARLNGKPLRLADVAQTLGPLTTAEDAQRWLRTVVQWAAAGMVPGTVAVGCASLLREWVKLYDIERVQRRLRELELEVATLREAPHG